MYQPFLKKIQHVDPPEKHVHQRFYYFTNEQARQILINPRWFRAFACWGIGGENFTRGPTNFQSFADGNSNIHAASRRTISRWRKAHGGVSTSRLRYFIRSTPSPTPSGFHCERSFDHSKRNRVYTSAWHAANSFYAARIAVSRIFSSWQRLGLLLIHQPRHQQYCFRLQYTGLEIFMASLE